MITNKRFMITGGAGFIGSHLAEILIENNNMVVILDDFSNGTMDNLVNIKDRIEIIEQDISLSMESIKQKFGSKKFDGIFNLACFPRSLSLQNPFRDLEVNARGTLNVLEFARENNAKVIFTSNSGIYGEPEYIPVDENHPDKPSTPYDANKLVSEYYLKIYNKIYSLPIAVCRLAAVFGERQRVRPGWKPLIPEFVGKIIAGESPVIFWDGNQTRDLIYVKDVVQGLLKAYQSDKTNGEVFLLSTNEEISVNDIFYIICKTLNKSIEPERADRIPGDIYRMKLSYEKAKKTFGFKPEYTFQQGLKNYIEWFKTNTNNG